MTDLAIIAVIIVVALIAFALGVWHERDRRETLLDKAADATVDELVARQVADDRRAIASMPPGVEVSDVLELADRHGIGVREAALILFRAHARARLDANLRRHHPASRSKHL